MTRDVATSTAGAAWAPVVPRLARPAAVENFAEQLLRLGLSESAAAAMSEAVVDPDAARRRLADPSLIRVQGGTLQVIDAAVWAPALSVFPANPRELGERLYRIGGAETGDGDAFRTLRSARERLAELAVTVRNPQAMSSRLTEAETWLRTNNDLTQDIGAEGVLQPVVAAALSVAHRNGHEPITMLAAIDGSSRTATTHGILDIDGGEQAYLAGTDPRALRQQIGRIIRAVGGDWAEMDVAGQRQARALMVPARLVVGFIAAQVAPVEFHVGIRNFIGLTHIRPPRPYGTAVENRAKADAVIDHLAHTHLSGAAMLSSSEANWFRGDITAAAASRAGLSDDLDVRTADICRALLHGGLRTARHVNNGIRALTAKQQPTRFERIDIAVELALRPVQAQYGLGSEDSLAPRRAALQRALRTPGITDEEFGGPIWEGLPDSPWTLDELRQQALREVAHPVEGRKLQTAQLELAVKAAFYMVAAEPMALRREGYGVDTAGRGTEKSIPTLLENMLGRRQGIMQAVACIQAGRAHAPLREVDRDGRAVTYDGVQVALTDARVREMYALAPSSSETVGIQGAMNRWGAVTETLSGFEVAVEQMREVRDHSGARYVEQSGWPPEQIETLRRQLDRLDRRLAGWADRAAELAAEDRRWEKDSDADDGQSED